LVIAAARIAGAGHAMVRNGLSQTAAGGRKQRATPDHGAQEASP
jgi:hypothetical protein